MPIHIDVSCLCDRDTDAVLDDMHKAISDPPPADGIWAPHDSPLLRRVVDAFTQRGLDRVDGLQAELSKWIKGDMHRVGGAVMTRPPGAMVMWTEAELAVTKLYLENLPPAQFALDDWMLLVDYLAHRYMAPDAVRTEAQWLASRTAIMGRVQAAMGAVEPTAKDADKLLVALATDAGARHADAGLSAQQRAVLDFGQARCCEHVVGLTDAVRHRMRGLVVNWQEAAFLGDKGKTAESLQTQLLDTFGALNRDWRRIAVTEATNNAGNGLIASLKAGTRVKRVERYKGACPFCRSIDGKIFTVVAPDKPDKDPETEVWAGKSNVGLSASPKKREGDRLVDRAPNEMWTVAAGAQHPNCQGSWLVLETSKRPVDPKFAKWMDEVLGRA